MIKYDNPLNMIMFNKVQELIGWPISPESPFAELPITKTIIDSIEKEFSMKIRGRSFPIKLNDSYQTISELIKDIDAQYTCNYFQSESGTYKGLIEVTDHKGEAIQAIEHKWKIRGKNLIARIKKFQEENPKLTILDLGCGYNMYKDHLDNVTGVDPYIESADILCKLSQFEPPHKYDIIICFGPMNWYSYDEQFRNMLKIKECLAEDGICFWSHVHDYHKVFAPSSPDAHTWIAGDLEDAFKNNAFYFYDRLWKYTQYFNWTENALNTLTNHVGLKPGDMQYDDCGCYRPPMWRLFSELTHLK